MKNKLLVVRKYGAKKYLKYSLKCFIYSIYSYFRLLYIILSHKNVSIPFLKGLSLGKNASPYALAKHTNVMGRGMPGRPSMCQNRALFSIVADPACPCITWVTIHLNSYHVMLHFSYGKHCQQNVYICLETNSISHKIL